MNRSATEGARNVPRRRWGIALLLGFGVLVNYFDRVNLSVSKEALHETFGISTVTFGYLLSAYSWTYGACQLPSGLLLDRFIALNAELGNKINGGPGRPAFNAEL